MRGTWRCCFVGGRLMLDRTQLVLRRVVRFLAGDNHSGILFLSMPKRRDSLQKEEIVELAGSIPSPNVLGLALTTEEASSLPEPHSQRFQGMSM